MTTAPTPTNRARSLEPAHVVAMTALVLLVVLAVVLVARSDRHTTVPGSSVVQGSGTTATQVRDVEPFTSVDLAGSNDVSIDVGSEQSVVVRADDNLIGLVTTEVRDGELVIGNRGSFRTESPMRVDITVPALEAIAMSGSGTLTVDGIRGDALSVRLPGSGTISVSGTTDRLEATLEGSGVLQLEDLVAAQATALVSGSGTIRLYASEALDASVTGAGTISYGGSPARVTKSVSGSGAIIEQ
jgi:hypothetical protein